MWLLAKSSCVGQWERVCRVATIDCSIDARFDLVVNPLQSSLPRRHIFWHRSRSENWDTEIERPANENREMTTRPRSVPCVCTSQPVKLHVVRLTDDTQQSHPASFPNGSGE